MVTKYHLYTAGSILPPFVFVINLKTCLLNPNFFCKKLSLKNFPVNFVFDLFLLSTNYLPVFSNMFSNVIFTLYFRHDLKLHPVTRLPHLQIVRVKKLWVKVWNMSSAAVAPVVATSQRSSSVTKATVDIFSKFLQFLFCYLRSRFIRFR